MTCSVAIVGMACRYPDADTPKQLLENSLAQRQSFRVIPEVRLAASGYFDASGSSPDRTYARQAAVLEGFDFDRAWFRVSRDSYEITDLTHWLALTVARETVEDIRFRAGGRHPDSDNVRVVVGNTLTGEFARAGLMRLRWPYVEQVVAQQLRSAGLPLDETEEMRFLGDLEALYKAPFPVPNEDFLSGGLANTIAGRICNHFDFRGGCYTVDGACSSSLLAVTDACSALAAGDADMVLAGGVDLSLDPFELVGFSRSAALARDEMLVYDEGSQGFWPGEGCGFVALMRYEDAVLQCERIYGVIRGWGISSDGRGGLTRPEADGQMLALRRCYGRASYGIGTVGYFEGHGTGTRVGDTAELTALICARSDALGSLEPAVISSVKANIGHTKAAAGIAGLLRATMCLAAHVRPPTTGCRDRHRLLSGNAGRLRVAHQAEAWPLRETSRRVGVSAAGFGGINTHVTVEEAPAGPLPTNAVATGWPAVDRFAGAQDAELFLFAASRREDLAWTVGHVAGFAVRCSRAELTDLAVELARRATRGALSPWKAAVVASTPAELDDKLTLLKEALEAADGHSAHLDTFNGVFLSGGVGGLKVGLAFSGQGSPARRGGGLHGRRFHEVRDTYRAVDLDSFECPDGTDFAQPAIVVAALAGLRLLERIGTVADVALGHSLGELVALHWAGHYDAQALLSMARTRGRVMAGHGAGAMAAIAADCEATAAALDGRPGVHLANLNAPLQTVVSGDRDAVEALVAQLRENGTMATMLKVGHAFHTPMMAGAAEDLGRALEGTRFGPGRRPVLSTVTGDRLSPTTDVISHLRNQCVAPVRFEEAATRAAAEVDLLLEVGPGHVLAGLLNGFSRVPMLPLDIGGESLKPFLAAAGAAYVVNAAPSIGRLYDDRFARRFNWSWNPRFLGNPCERGPAVGKAPPDASRTRRTDGAPAGGTALARLRQIVANHTGLPAWRIEDSSRMLSDLHLNSITVGEIVGRLVQALGVVFPPVDPTEYADASLSAIAEAILRLSSLGAEAGSDGAVSPDGIGHWVRSYRLTRRSAAGTTEPAGELGAGVWEGFGPGADGAEWLIRHLDRRPLGRGVVVWMGRQPDSSSIEPLVSAAQRCAALATSTEGRPLFVVVQPGWGGGGFARSWFLEEGIDTLVVNVDPEAGDSPAPLIADEIRNRHPGADPARAPAFTEVFLDIDGIRTEPHLETVRSSTPDALPIGAADVVLVTGGGKGISAECAQQLALRTGCALLVLGRSSPDASPELAGNLERFRQSGVRVTYRMADVTDAVAVASAVADGVGELGAPVTGIVHAAGTNHPRLVTDLSPTTAAATLAPKLDGLRNALAAVDTDRLRLLVTFGSIIARLGLRGEADYALANEWLSHEAEAFQARHPACRCRSIEWSLWSGAGMGQRLGRVEALVQQGISPISIDEGIREFQRLVDTPGGPVSVVVTGRFGTPPTIGVVSPEIAQLRFIESTLVFYPGVELVADCRLSPDSDPYLDDHVLAEERLLPAVMALEAMAEAAVCVIGDAAAGTLPVFRDVRFKRAVVVGRDREGVTVRVAALVQPDGGISLAIRSSATSFRINHVEATAFLRPTTGPTAGAQLARPAVHGFESPEPARALYRTVLFQTGFFERVAGFRTIKARHCEAWLSADEELAWFSGHRAQCRLLLGDPGARDGALHAIQACIPHRVVIPTAVGEIETGALDPVHSYGMSACEVADRGDELVYDLTIHDRDRQVVERWSNVTLRVVGEPPKLRLDSPTLMAPFLERRIAVVDPAAGLRVTLVQARDGCRRRQDGSAPGHRPDGKPDSADDRRLRSVAYNRDWRLDVRAHVPTGCDLESVEGRSPERWASLLGDGGLELAQVVADLLHENRDVSATRVWTTREALKKAGAPPTSPLVVDSDSSTRLTVFRSGTATVFSSVIEAHGPEPGRCVAVALRREADGEVG